MIKFNHKVISYGNENIINECKLINNKLKWEWMFNKIEIIDKYNYLLQNIDNNVIEENDYDNFYLRDNLLFAIFWEKINDNNNFIKIIYIIPISIVIEIMNKIKNSIEIDLKTTNKNY